MNLNQKPGPNKIWKANSKYINSKIKTIIGLLILFMVGLSFVYILNFERESRYNSVILDVQKSYGAAQTISSPYFINPIYPRDRIYPENLEITVDSNHQTKNRGIFQVPVYTTEVTMTGSFKANASEISSYLYISDSNKVSQTPSIKIDNSTISNLNFEDGAFTNTKILNNNNSHRFTITFKANGTKGLYFNVDPESKNNTINLTSSWPHPSFKGDIGVTESTITEDGFTSSWEFTGAQIYNSYEYIGYELYEPNSIYKKTDRSIKYGICVIALVFFSFMIVELLSGTRVNNLQYILVGLSLIVYYTLLLSLGEIIGFNTAYLIASISTILLNTAFVKLMIKKIRYSISIGTLLSTIYALIFLLLQTTEYTLLLGSISAYIIVATAMFSTYFINFDSKTEETE